MIRRITIFFLSFLITIHGIAQVISIDSLKRELHVPKHDTDLVYTMGWLSYQFNVRDQYDSALYYAKAALELSERINYEKGKGYAYIDFGNYYAHFADYPKALNYYSEAKRIMERLGDMQFLAIANSNLGRVYSILLQKPEGIDLLNTALQQFETIGDHTNASYVLRSLAAYYDSRGNTTKALELYFASLKKTDKTGNAIASAALQKIAAIYLAQGNKAAAIEYSLKALEVNKAVDLKYEMAHNHNTIAEIYLREKRYDSALIHIQSALTVFRELGENGPDYGLPWCYLLMGNLYEAQAENSSSPDLVAENHLNAEKNYLTGIEEALKNDPPYAGHLYYGIGMLYYKQKRFKLARSFMDKSAAILQHKEQETMQNVYLYLSRLDSIYGNYKDAFRNYKSHIVIRDSLINHDLTSKSEGLKMQYEFDKKEDSLKQRQTLTQARLDTQKKQKNYYLGGAILLALLSVFVFLNFRNQKKINSLANDAHAKEKAELELQSLRAQLNPHFMFNSLNAIQELILKEENEKSQSYLARFAKLLRMLLENADKPFIPLQREIDFLQLYLSLENLRIPDLRFSIDVDSRVDAEKTIIPNMILQPYIENAIWHGLSHKENDKQLRIRINQAGGITNYEIEDNGVGRKKAAELKSLYRKEHKSKGMELLSKRFKLLAKEYGSDIETKISDVTNNIDITGTFVRINVPLHLK